MTPWESYTRYLYDFHSILRDMSRRGLPISEPRRLELKAALEAERESIDAQVKALVPKECLGTAKGLKRTPKDITGFTQIEVVVEKEEKCSCLKAARASCALCAGTGMLPLGLVVKRWARVVEFNPNSSHQVKRFIKFLKHPVPKHAKRTDAVTGEAAETTEVKELERLYAKTKHPLYPLLIRKRQITKMIGTYVVGWAPSKDGRVHTTFTFGPATWQLSSKEPNVQNGPKRGRSPEQKKAIELFNRMQMAQPGRMLVNFDAKSFHAQTTACEASLYARSDAGLLANAAEYLRLAKIDLHSFTTCHFIKHSERHGLLKWSDADLKGFFSEMKANKTAKWREFTFKEIREGKTKSAGLGIGFGMRGPKIYKTYQEDFASQAEAISLWNLIMMELFPSIYNFQEKVKEEAAENKVLYSMYGGQRQFYDVQRWSHSRQKMEGGDQAEAAIAYKPAANAFGMMRTMLMEMQDAFDALRRFEAINTVHDSIVFHPDVGDVDECASIVSPVMERPSKVLVYPICPNGLSVEAECSVGLDLASMVNYAP